MSRIFASLSLICALGLLVPAPATAITIDTVPVGDVGNANDPATGNLYGGVNYAYNIGKYEVTVGQYTAFLNAVADDDRYRLYGLLMAGDLEGISRTGSSPNYSYSVIGSADHPVNYVTWGNAARFANWLYNGQPTGPQNASTTEDGSYFLNGATISEALATMVRKPGATWVIPSESEWYKAAYYQPAAAGGDSDSYWLYPTRTNSEPNSDQPPGDPSIQANAANFFRDDGLANGYNDGFADRDSTILGYLTDVGAYASSPSYYNTFDQAGNVMEWNETRIFPFLRGLRGGAWISESGPLGAWFRYSEDPRYGFGAFGFRVATVPEPSTAVLASIACGLIWTLRRRCK